jgi:hypothetical protein
MEIWQLWNGKLKLELHRWKQDKYDTPICKPSNNVGNLLEFGMTCSSCKCTFGIR